MDSDPWVIPLAAAALCDDQRIGGKAAQLARLRRAGFRIAPEFCVTVAAYEQFLRDTQLQRIIQMEAGSERQTALIPDLAARQATAPAAVPARG